MADDDPGLRELYEATLGEHWRLRVAGDEDEALAALDDAVAVALLDGDLGGGSGDAVLAAIRERGIDCRVAMVTGVAPDADVVDMDLDEYLTKPVAPDRLRETVSDLLLGAEYDEPVHEHFALARKRVVLEDELDRSILEGTPAYEALCDRLDVAREAADDALDELGERDAYDRPERERRRSAASV